MPKPNIYDYVMSKAEVKTILDYYDCSYTIKGDCYWMCCPFHVEKAPSFSFNFKLKLANCWGGCKKKWNIFTFIQEYELVANGEEISYYEAMVKCAKICKIKINLTYKDELEMEMESIDDISDIVDNELATPKVQEIFLETAIKKFYNKKNNFMVDKGYKKEILDYLEMGFFVGDHKNNMNNRCVFPVRNDKGQLVGWTGRTIFDNVEPKWLHAPTKRFLKALNLYNIDKALPYILERNVINVVESIGNTIRMIESNRYNTVATLGSTISKEQCEMLMSYGADVVFWYDWDQGGFEGLNLVIDYIHDYDRLFVAVTDYGFNVKGKAKDIGDVDVKTVDKTQIISIYEYIELMKARYVSYMADEFVKDKKIKLTDGTVVLCTNKVNNKIDIRQLTPSDITLLKSIDALFGVSELSAYDG